MYLDQGCLQDHSKKLSKACMKHAKDIKPGALLNKTAYSVFEKWILSFLIEP